MTTDGSDSVLAALGVDPERLPSVPDDVWARALDSALTRDDGTASADLVPELSDQPVVPDDEPTVLTDDADDLDADADSMSSMGFDEAGDSEVELEAPDDVEFDEQFTSPALPRDVSEEQDFGEPGDWL